MKFSNCDVISREAKIIESRKEMGGLGIMSRLYNTFLIPRYPKHTFHFYIPEDIYIRAVSFSQDVEDELGKNFTVSDLANVLYTDFIEYIRNTNDVHDTYKRLKVRNYTPTKIIPYSTEEVYNGVLFEEVRGFEIVSVTVDHRDALRGEYVLKDMIYHYPNHGYILENIMEIVFYDFINDYRKGLIKNPVQKIMQYC